ncbi:MAG TPA: hypothetical protein VKR32_05700 [Puia sp.]|nr:hypothetical protein [Puia sp.]
MSFKEKIRKIAFITTWCVAGAGVVVLLIAAINKRNSKACKAFSISIIGAGSRPFVEVKTVEAIITLNHTRQLEGQPIAGIDLKKIEDSLKKNIWIRNAELFFDNNEVMQVYVWERQPVARVFSTQGTTFFLDSMGVQLPVLPGPPVKLPVITGYPHEKLQTHGKDSVLLNGMRSIGAYILRDSFWMAQIDQVDINRNFEFELVPLIGNQIIEFGDGGDCLDKFGRLYLFYKDVLSKTGFNKYSRIKIQYRGQVIGTRRIAESGKADSIKFIKNVQQMILSAQQMQADTARQNTKPLENTAPSDQPGGDEESNANAKDNKPDVKQGTVKIIASMPNKNQTQKISAKKKPE